jgi:putative ABC transport system substrate-binding protein
MRRFAIADFRFWIGGPALFILALAFALLLVPCAAEAQQAGKLIRIGQLVVPAAGPPGSPRPIVARLSELGYVEGRDYSMEYRYAEGNYDRLPALAADLVRTRVDMIFASGNTAAQVALEATNSIPVVTVSCDAFTLVTSLARHGRNLCGVTCMRIELTEKRLEIFKEAVPKATRVAVLYNPLEGPEGLQFTEAAAQQLKVALVPVPVLSAKDFEPALDSVRQQRPDALFVNPDAVLISRHRQIAEFALQHRLPAINPFSEFVAAGGLMSYGASSRDLARRGAELIAKIFEGAKPSDLPIEQATRFYLVINLKTAKALGLTIPPSLLIRADQVIE